MTHLNAKFRNLCIYTVHTKKRKKSIQNGQTGFLKTPISKFWVRLYIKEKY